MAQPATLSERYIIGVDGGQTTTKCALATTNGRVLATGQGGPLIHLAAEGGEAHFVAAVSRAIHDAWRSAGRPPQPLAAIGLGLTGVEADSVEAQTVLRLLPQIVRADYVDVQNDSVTALVGAHLDAPGIIVIAGTGTIALGQDHYGHRRSAGGWGWLLGDRGSAMDIGRTGLTAALDAADGVGPPTTLQKTFFAHFNLGEPRDIKRIVYAPTFGARGFAALAPKVAQVAAEGDTVAGQIIWSAGQALAASVLALTRQLDFDGQLIPIAPIGGAFAHLAGLQPAFTAALRAGCPQAVVRPPLLSPIMGAVLLALKGCGVPLAAVLPLLQRAAV